MSAGEGADVTEESNATLETVSAVRKKLAIEVSADAVRRELDRTFDSVRRHATVRGFRPGRAPRSVLERLYGDQVRRDVMARLVETSFRKAIEDHALSIVGAPEIDATPVEGSTPFRYTALVDVPPAVEIADLATIRAERRPVAVTDEDVDRVLERMRERSAQLRPIEDRAVVESGDVVTVDVTSRLDDNPPQTRTDVMIEAGTGTFEGAFENLLIGQSVGEHADLEVMYPDDYANGGLAGKRIAFAVDVKAIHAKELPELDDGFAAEQQAGVETLADLKAKIRADLEGHAASEAERGMRELVAEALVERHAFEAPPSVVEQRAEAMLSSYGVRLPEGPEGAELRERLLQEARPRAERDVRIDFILDAIAGREAFQVDESDIEAEIERQAESDRQPDRVRTFYAREEARDVLRRRLLRARAFEHVLGVATIVDVPPESRVAPS